jgi:hypothetical protein
MAGEPVRAEPDQCDRGGDDDQVENDAYRDDHRLCRVPQIAARGGSSAAHRERHHDGQGCTTRTGHARCVLSATCLGKLLDPELKVQLAMARQ